jgi:hypothetical protein
VFRTILFVLPAFILLAVAVWYVAVGWSMGEGTHVGAAGYIAMVMGVLATFALAAVLILLLLRRGPGDE